MKKIPFNKHYIHFIITFIIILLIITINTFFNNRIKLYRDLTNKKLPIKITPDQFYSKKLNSHMSNYFSKDNVGIHNNMRFEYLIDFMEGGKIPLYFIAKGSSYKNIYPLISLKIDGEFQDSFFVTSSEWGLFQKSLHIKKGVHLLEIAYTNDGFNSLEDRNLYFNEISINKYHDKYFKYIRLKVPFTIDPYKMSSQYLGKQNNGFYHLWRNGILSDYIYFSNKGLYLFYISAFKNDDITHPLNLKIIINKDNPIKIAINSKNISVYKFEYNVTKAGLHSLKLINDSKNDIIIHKISIGAPFKKNYLFSLTQNDSKSKKNIKLNDFNISSTISKSNSELQLFSNGFLEKNITFEKDIILNFQMLAQASFCNGKGPIVILQINNNQITSFEINSEKFKTYKHEFKLLKGKYNIKIIYNNDKFISNNNDRNLFIKDLNLNIQDL